MKTPTIDIHAHILPGLDDGPAGLEESLEMARMAVADGTRTMIATPHCLNGLYENRRPGILLACEEFNSVLKRAEIPLEVLPGSEARFSPELIEELNGGRLMTLNDTGRYFFLELPGQFVPEAVTGLVGSVKREGITPIITHPERNMTINRHMDILSDMVSAGALSQVTAQSLTGEAGRAMYRAARRMIQMGAVHFVASDAHSPKARPPGLSRAFRELASMAGEEKAGIMMLDFPGAVIEGKDILVDT